jgi:2,5-diketo-D-gluconate reductase A
MQSILLNNGISMPVIGYGTYKITEEFHPKECVLQALEAGYRRIDTATLYRNEKQIGEALSECGIPREKLFITTKLWTNVRKEEDVAPPLMECAATCVLIILICC